MSREAFKARTKAYALRVIKVVDALPRDMVSKTLGQQLLRCGTSVAANYRAAVRGKSAADFIAKMGIVEEECDESLLWMELLIEANRMKPARLADLMREGGEILAVTVASIKTARRGK
ncbi:MAG TPA: four helix bundle protein [Opitutaceae bacterium]|nr:four helix bundle protein [Opitutaceae bacterium]